MFPSAAAASAATATVLGPGRPGVSPRQLPNSINDYEAIATRRVLRDSWDKPAVQTSINGHGRVLTPFRAAYAMGDYLARSYSCGVAATPIPRRRPGWMQRNGPQTCDGTGVATTSCNPRWVPDCSDFIKFKRQAAILKTYNPVK